ncbi:MAG TPA: 2'-5' RNA ligase family protein [Naasia sp.]|jgi:2'-5' RNA ligase
MSTDVMTDPELLAALSGQQYLMLRPTGAVAAEFERVAAAVREIAPDGVSFPGAPHVTLGGFAVPDRLEELRDCVSDWAAGSAPLRVAIEALTVSSSPHRVVVLRVRRTAELMAAMTAVREKARQAGLIELDDGIAPERWVFHLSVAYGRGVADEDWDRFATEVAQLPVGPLEEEISEAELAVYGRHEHRGVFPLGGATGEP